MIRVKKSREIPPSLLSTAGYDGRDVVSQLDKDQKKKCYLCERVRDTDYEVEHRKSQSKNPDDRQNWQNLFLVCGYCNRRKSHLFDDIADPGATNVEVLISQRIDFANKKALYGSVGQSDYSIERSIALLDRLFNGKNGMREYREEKFFEYFIGEMNRFLRVVNDYLFDPTPEHEFIVEECLGIDQEFLGFKYWVVMDNPLLAERSSGCCVWNRV